jgi:PAS domain S-box-containing protein
MPIISSEGPDRHSPGRRSDRQIARETIVAAYFILGLLIALAVYQQYFLLKVRRNAKKREELFQIVTENAADMIALVDVKGRRLYNSPAYKRILGYSPAELSETSAFEQIHPDDRFNVLEAAREARSTGSGKKLEYRVKHKDGTWRVLESIASTIRDAKGEVAKLVIVNRDVTDRKHAEQQLEHNSFHDPLTGLPNRRLFLDRLQNLFLRGKRHPGRTYALLIVDVDGFKKFNDTMGARVGDLLLSEIARRLSSCLRQEDTVARGGSDRQGTDTLLSRLGGDEFTILLDPIAEPSDALRVAKRMQAGVTEPLQLEGREVRPSASVGIAIYTTTHERAEDLLQDAESALRRAKALSGSHCELFDQAMHDRAVNRLRLEAELRAAVSQHQFEVYYQPLVELKTQRAVGFEALLRWHHPQQGLISPYKFLDAAEDTGLIVAIGQWLLTEACRRMSAWQAGDYSVWDLNVNVNLSPRQFNHSHLVDDVREALRQTGLDPSRLRLEITDGVTTIDPRRVADVLTLLKRLAVCIVLDDFGAGQSSLLQLKRLPIDALKIGRPLIGEMLTDRGADEIVDAIVTLGHKLHLTIVGGGIENAKQAERLRQFGCDLGQGYLFSAPLDATAAEQFLRQQAGRPAMSDTRTR